eukprot:scaffold5059_cov72-Phaeocystis_antarctica.AAC.3
MSTRNVPAGRWMKCCRAQEVESPAILPTMSTRNVPAGRRCRHCLGRFRRRERTLDALLEYTLVLISVAVP